LFTQLHQKTKKTAQKRIKSGFSTSKFIHIAQFFFLCNWQLLIRLHKLLGKSLIALQAELNH